MQEGLAGATAGVKPSPASAALAACLLARAQLRVVVPASHAEGLGWVAQLPAAGGAGVAAVARLAGDMAARELPTAEVPARRNLCQDTVGSLWHLPSQ